MSSVPPAPAESKNTYICPKEVLRDPESCREIVLLVRANAMYEAGNYSEALRLYDESVEQGSVEARIYRGFAMAERACVEGSGFEGLENGLKDSLWVIAKIMEPQYLLRLKKILEKAVAAGYLKGDKQLCVEESGYMDVHSRIMDFIRLKGDARAALENLREYLDALGDCAED